MYDIKTKDSDYMTLVLTHECRRACSFCSDKYRGRKEYIRMKDVDKALTFASERGCRDILLTGGEATEHPEVIEIAKKVKEKGFNLILTTNYDNPETMKSLDGIVDSFNVSYYGQKKLPNQKDFKADITLSCLIWKERFPTKEDLDKFIDEFEDEYHLKFSTLNSSNEWCQERKETDYLDELSGERIRVFEFYPAQMYRGHVIMRCDLPHIENDSSAWKIFPNGEITKKWTRSDKTVVDDEKQNGDPETAGNENTGNASHQSVKHKFAINDLKLWHADLIITHECNRKCKFCIDDFVNTSHEPAKLEDIEAYLKFLSEEEKKNHPDMSSVLILGGEPTSVPFEYLKETADLIHHYGFNATMTTNGQAEAKLLELDGYIDFINISHYGKKAVMDDEYLYQFKKSEITISKLITKESFPTYDSFKAFIKEIKGVPINYRFSTLQKETRDFDRLHAKWFDDELLAEHELTPVLECLYATEYDGYVIKIMHVKNEATDIEFPLYPKLWTNGNMNRDFSTEEHSIDYKNFQSNFSADYPSRIKNEFDYSSRNHWMERSLSNHESRIPNAFNSTVIAENDTMALMTINKCFVPGTVSIASKAFHLSSLLYSDKEKEDYLDMLNRVSSFLEKKLGFKPLVSEHAANQYENVKKELSKFIQLVPPENQEQTFDVLKRAWHDIIRNDSGIHSHALVIPHLLSRRGSEKTINDMGLKELSGYDEFFKQDPLKKYDYFIDNDGCFYFSNDDDDSYFYKDMVVRHCVAEENGIPYLPSRPAKNLEIYHPIIYKTLEIFEDFNVTEGK